MSNLNSYIPIVEFIANFLGHDSEVILYDTNKDMVVFVKHPFDPNIGVGSPIPDMEKKFIKQKVYEEEDSLVNYRAFSFERRKLRSASHFIKNSGGELTGIITINYKVDELIELRSVLNRLISGQETIQYKGEDFYESFDLSFEDLMNKTIQDVLAKFDVAPDRLSQEEKIELIRSLDQKGIFLIKGSVAEVSKVLNTSETSIYRYINKL
ncbi:Transcriptional regulator [Sporosarcina sp. ANT_H38]|uniref:helix-turn-helix transcriptional regulator n=1 Tax=Sporosarcina sp. ANT_H38 TaxID=2597358 RepID=UPI00165E90D9|nr:helix-turn-helix domain-containing protein [Sporosarcina sp. ANT_H38]